MQNTAISNSKVLKTGLKITIENTSRFLEYHKTFWILIYITYGYIVCNLADYLSKSHRGTKKERGKIVK